MFNHSSLSYVIVLALTSAATNLTDIALIFHHFPRPKIKFHDFPGLENEILKFDSKFSMTCTNPDVPPQLRFCWDADL